jgi:hypothetical protein
MDIKSFAVGMLVASVISIASIASAEVSYDKPDNCDDLLIKERVVAYEHGYFTCLKDVDPDMYNAYLSGYALTQGIEEQATIDSIVTVISTKYGFDDEQTEYLYTLITD